MDVSIVDRIKSGGIGVLPTDTLYGLVGSALLPETVERIYKIRERDKDKPFIILVSDISEVEKFGADVSQKITSDFLAKNWPGEVSVILPLNSEGVKKFEYLHRGGGTLAFRMPNKKDLLELISKTGPITAPSANPQGMPSARTIEEAKKYFGDRVDFYIDGGLLSGEPSTIVKFENGKMSVVREGIKKVI